MVKHLLCFLAGIGVLQAAPTLEISPASHSFGKYPANQGKSHTFILKNSGDEMLKIEKVRHTCGCSAAELDRNELKPGESAQLKTTILPESIAGPFSKGIFIHSNAGNGKLKMVTLSGQSEPLVTVLPQKELYLGTLKAGEELVQKFVLSTRQPVKFGQPELSGDIKPQIIFEKDELRIVWTPSGEMELFRCTVTIPVAEPENWKPIEINLQGRVVK